MSVDTSTLVSALPSAVASWLGSFAQIVVIPAGLILAVAVAGIFVNLLQRARRVRG